MNNLMNRIEALEAKIENGTITMNEEVLFYQLTELAMKFINS